LNGSQKYLDSNSGAPLHPKVIEALLFYLRAELPLLPNPSSVHAHGRSARKIVDDAKLAILNSMGASPKGWDVTFCSSGTDANQTAIRSALEPSLERGERVHWITTPLEHSCVRLMIEWVRKRGGDVSLLPVTPSGEADLDALPGLIRPGETRLVSLLWTNNETGITSHIPSALRACSAMNVPLHVDAVATWGKSRIDLGVEPVDFVAVSGHKVGALSGTGVVVARKNAFIANPFAGTHQGGKRGGTENVIGIVALGAAAATIPEQIEEEARLQGIREELEAWIKREIPEAHINGASASRRTGHLLSLTLRGFQKDLSLVNQLDLAGFSVSSGSACSSGLPEPSVIMLALGHSRIDALNTVRISLHPTMGHDTVLRVGETLKRIIDRARTR